VEWRAREIGWQDGNDLGSPKIDDHVSTMYTGKPTPIYLIGKDERVVYNPGIGPFGFNPKHLGEEIAAYLGVGA
jgi:hypothetical protein